jgi:hypothetical protein
MKGVLRSTHKAWIARVTIALVVLLGLTAGVIIPAARWAWGTNVGWIDFVPTPGAVVGVYRDHLEGFAWGENIGWIHMGSFSGGSPHTYTNISASDYGVNRDRGGRLGGYAWSPTVGWINFQPPNGGVNIDPLTGKFSGFAWGENIGWIRFTGNLYGVITDFREHQILLPIAIKTP